MHIKWLLITTYLKQQILTTYLVTQQDHAQGENPPSELLNYCLQVRVSEVHLQSAATGVNVSLQQPPYSSKSVQSTSSLTCLIILIFVIQQGVFFGQKVSVNYTCIQLTQESTSKCSNLPQNALCRR